LIATFACSASERRKIQKEQGKEGIQKELSEQSKMPMKRLCNLKWNVYHIHEAGQLCHTGMKGGQVGSLIKHILGISCGSVNARDPDRDKEMPSGSLLLDKRPPARMHIRNRH